MSARPSLYRLQVSIVETRRFGGKVRHEHVYQRFTVTLLRETK
jgi:hypothetical protein